jgi:hypothetical protein
MLLATKVEEKRFAKRIAKPDVSEPTFFQLNQQRHVIKRRIKATFIARDPAESIETPNPNPQSNRQNAPFSS